MQIINTQDRDSIDALDADQRHWIYNGLDVCITAEVRKNILPEMDDVATHTYQKALELQAPFMEMMLRGIPVDKHNRSRIRQAHEISLAKVAAQLNRLVNEGLGWSVDFNANSPKQVKELFFEKLALPVIRKRNTNGQMAPASDRETLEKLGANYFNAVPFVSHVLAIREYKKAIGFLKTPIDADGHIRCNINLAGTNTGRVSSSVSDFGTGTNLQNVDPANRGIFVAPKGRKFINIDLEQADSRGVGAIAWNCFVESHGEDWAGSYLDACESGDLHTTVCNMAWRDLPWPEDREGWRAIANGNAYREHSYRDMAKKLGHGTNYMGQPFTMSIHTKVPVPQIENFQRNYYGSFPCIPAWQQWTIEQLQQHGCLSNLFGRRRYFFGRRNDQQIINAAIAYSPQGTTGDAINAGILNLWRYNNGETFQLHIQVHDSILLSIPEEQEDELVPLANSLMLAPIQLKRNREFIIPVEAQTGWNWGYESKANPHGLTKWRGSDSRTSPKSTRPMRRRSVRDLL